MSDPLFFLHTSVFDQCDHRVSAAKCEEADLREGQKEIEDYIQFPAQ
jgi:hypothetical protein